MIATSLQVIDTVSPAAGAGGTISTESTTIIAVIVGLSAIALGKLLRSWMSAQSDLTAIAARQRLIEDADDFEKLRSIAKALPQESFLRRRLEVCSDLQRLGAEADIAALRALTEDALERSLRFPRWVAANVVLLGLLGTVLGLVVAVSNGAAAVSAGTDASVQGTLGVLTNVFGGLQTGFLTTLVGIVSAVLLGLSISQVRGAQLHMREALERLSLVALYPRLRTSPEQALAQASQSLNFIQRRLEGVLTQILVGIREHSEQTLGRLDAHAKTVTGALADSSEKFSLQMSGSASAFLERTAAASEALAALVGEPSEERVSLTEIGRAVADASQLVGRSAESLSASAPVVGEQVARQVDAQTRDLAELVTQLASQAQATLKEHSVETLSAVRRVVSDEAESRDRHIREMLDERSAYEKRIGDTLQRLSEVASSLEAVVTASKKPEESTGASSAAVEANLIHLHRTQEQALKVLQDLRTTMISLKEQATEEQPRARGFLGLFGRR